MNAPDEPPPQQLANKAPPKIAVLQYSRRRHVSGCPKPQPPPITRVFSRRRNKPIPVPEPSVPRKTRDLPNISECHACGFRINLGSGKDRLRTLYSEWRIVLLCKKCISRVESSAVCSYCFGEASEGFLCCDCKRRIHKSCFMDYKDTAPWSYSCSGSEFSVCVDCWVPKSLAKIRTSKRKKRAKKRRQVVLALRCDRVKELGDIAEPLQNVEQGAILLRGSMSERSTDKVLMENVTLSSNSVGAKRNDTSAREFNETVGSDKVLDDAELALRLHRSMNSSPRISKKLCLDLEKTSIMVYRRMAKHTSNKWIRASDSLNGSFFERIQFCVNEPSHSNLGKSSSEHCLMSCHDSPVNEHLAEENRVVGHGSSQEDYVCLIKCDREDENLHATVQDCEGSSSNGMRTECETCSKYDEPLKLIDAGNVEKIDRCLMTYCKKRLSLNKDDRCKNLYERITSSE